MNEIIDGIMKFFEPIYSLFWDFIKDYIQIVVSLNPRIIFVEDKAGSYKPVQWSATILVVNNTRDNIKIEDVGFILSSGQKLIISPFLQQLEIPKQIEGKSHIDFGLEPDTLLKIGGYGIRNLKKVYVTDATFREFKGNISRKTQGQLNQIISAIQSYPELRKSEAQIIAKYIEPVKKRRKGAKT
jgi:hypothetical protein